MLTNFNPETRVTEIEEWKLHIYKQFENTRLSKEEQILSTIGNYFYDNNVEAILALLRETNSHINTTFGNDKKTVLQLAVWSGQLSTVRSLLTIDGIDVNVANKYGATPLHYAVVMPVSFYNKLMYSIVKELVYHSSFDVVQAFSIAKIPIYYAAIIGANDVVKLLLTQPFLPCYTTSQLAMLFLITYYFNQSFIPELLSMTQPIVANIQQFLPGKIH